MSEAGEEAKELWQETVRAFKSGLHGEQYTPDLDAPEESESSVDTERYEQLAKLADLRDRGALSEEEFAREKAKLLGTQ